MKPKVGDYVICVNKRIFFENIIIGQRYLMGGYMDSDLSVIWVSNGDLHEFFPLDCFEIDIKYTRLQKLNKLNNI